MNKAMARTKSDRMFPVIQKYLAQGGTEPIDLHHLATWAIECGEWDKHGIKNLQLRLCKKEFSRALREQYHTDRQGRRSTLR